MANTSMVENNGTKGSDKTYLAKKINHNEPHISWAGKPSAKPWQIIVRPGIVKMKNGWKKTDL